MKKTFLAFLGIVLLWLFTPGATVILLLAAVSFIFGDRFSFTKRFKKWLEARLKEQGRVNPKNS